MNCSLAVSVVIFVLVSRGSSLGSLAASTPAIEVLLLGWLIDMGQSVLCMAFELAISVPNFEASLAFRVELELMLSVLAFSASSIGDIEASRDCVISAVEFRLLTHGQNVEQWLPDILLPANLDLENV